MLSTAAKELEAARAKQAEARDREWENPRDTEAERMRTFWDSEANNLSTMNPETIFPLF